MKKGKTKVAVIGAGFVGATSAYVMALRKVCTELVLIDVVADKAAGEAAAICVEQGIQPRQVDVKLLQERLLKNGAVIE